MVASQPTFKRLRDEDGHRYYQFDTPGSRPLPSVTSVLTVIAKPALMAWSRNTALESMRLRLLEHEGQVLTREVLGRAAEEARLHPTNVQNRAAQHGARGHEAFEHVVRGTQPRPDVPPELAGAVHSFERWWGGSGFQLASAELVVRSERYGYAGQCDAVAVRPAASVTAAHLPPSEGVALAVLDWKTSNAIYTEYALQVSAYAKALEEMCEHALPVHEAWVVRIGKQGNGADFEARRVTDVEQAFLTFRAALYLFNQRGNELFTE